MSRNKTVSLSILHFFLLTFLLSLCLFGCSRDNNSVNTNIQHTSTPDSRCTWKNWRKDKLNTGYQNVSGNITGNMGVLWKYDMSFSFSHYMAVSDVNNDGIPEVLVCKNERLYCYSKEGQFLWKTDLSLGEIGNIIGVYDIDGDGSSEILAGNGITEWGVTKPKRANLHILSGTGESLFRFDYLERYKDYGDSYNLNQDRVKVRDVNGDGKQEIFLCPGANLHLIALDFSNGVRNGTILWDHDWADSEFGQVFPSLGDVDGDGEDELVAVVNDNLCILSARTGEVKLLKEVTGYVYGTVLLEDLDGDGVCEIIYLYTKTGENSIQTFSFAGGKFTKKASYLFDNTINWTRDAISDVDGDGRKEVVLNMKSNGYFDTLIIDPLTCVRKDRIKGLEYYIVSSLEKKGSYNIAGIDADGNVQIYRYSGAYSLAGTISGKEPVFFIRGYNIAGERQLKQAMEAMFHADINGDGVNEIFLLDPSETSPTLQGYSFTSGEVEKVFEGKLSKPLRGLMDSYRDDKNPENSIVVFSSKCDGFQVFNSDGSSRVDIEGEYYRIQPQVCDVDNDNVNEIIVKTNENRMKILKASSGNPTEVPGAYSGGYMAYPGNYAVIDNFVKEDRAHILLSSDDYRIKMIDYMGAESWNYKSSQKIDHISGGYFDGDALPDVLVNCEKNFYLLSGKDGSKIREFSISREPYPPLVIDYNGDGTDDIMAIVVLKRVFAINGSDGKILKDFQNNLLCHDGIILADYFQGDGSLRYGVMGNYTAFCFDRYKFWDPGWSSEGLKNCFGGSADLNGDGAADLVHPSNCGVYAFDGKTGSLLWNFLTAPIVATSDAALCDINGDGNVEVIVGGYNGKLYVLSGTDGAILSSIELDADLPVEYPTIADVNGDGKPEILVFCAGKLICLGAEASGKRN